MSTKDEIITLPNKHLRKRSVKVGIVSEEIKAIIQGMEDATLDWENSRKHELGVALAAVQMDKLLRIVIIREDFENKNNTDFTVFINPTITKYEGDLVDDYEGCLSIKDVYGLVPRYEKVKVKAIDLNGNEFRVTAEGFLARIFQHEIDHTNGILFIDHIKDDADSFYNLTPKGHLESLDYEHDVQKNPILW
ncbi:MAG: peptide deformylase [Alphaproteobacteria bacterium]